MRYTVKTKDFKLNGEQAALAKRLSISERFLKLLLGRGMKEDEMQNYLHPSLSTLMPVMQIAGMREAAERIKAAIKNKQRILIYGDYDCDGVCAISILTLYLRDKTDVKYFIPERSRDGYGISVAALERLLDKRKFDLVITVDCGITACDEVRYLRSQGIDVIVTDHHEPQAEIPDCIVVDAKIEKKGFYELCGAGIALRLVEAIAGMSEAKKYLDIAAIATIADVVPLVSDNRVIAYYGLKALNENARKGIRLLFGEGRITSQDIMFRIAPRMNAAGRLDSAMKVVELFTENDYFLLKTLAEELGRDNALRQEMCEKAAEEAKAMLKGRDFGDIGIIILYGENWEAGILGIAAAKLVEEFKRPAILFAKTGDVLKGSARSIAGVNIFELLNSMSGYFTSFGGHAQAAGVSLKEENFEAFREEANRRVLSACRPADFTPSVECEMELDGDMDYLSFAKELELLEPTGHCNERPNFLISSDGRGFERIGFSSHVKASSKGLDVMGFSKYGDVLPYRIGNMKLEVSLGINVFQNKMSAQAIIRSFETEGAEISDEDAKSMNLHQLSYEGSAQPKPTDLVGIEEFLKEPFGTAILCFESGDYQRLKDSEKIASLPLYVGKPSALNPENVVVLCPSADFDFAYFKRVVIAGNVLSLGYVSHIADSVEVYALEGTTVQPPRISDDTLRNIYRALLSVSRRNEKGLTLRKLYSYVNANGKMSEYVFLIAMRIFEDVKLVEYMDRGQIKVSAGSVRLSDSATYRNLLHG